MRCSPPTHQTTPIRPFGHSTIWSAAREIICGSASSGTLYSMYVSHNIMSTPSSFILFRCPCPCFVFLSGLSCTIYICIWLPFLPYAYYIMWLSWFVFVPWFFPLLNPSLAKMSSAGYFHARFLLSAFFSFLFFSDRVRPQFVLV